MSVIAALRNSSTKTKAFGAVTPRISPTDKGPGRDLWRQVFGAPTHKEAGLGGKLPADARGGGWGNSITGTKAAVEKLIQALRSRAPGGWSDDRWEQTMRHYVGITYIAVFRKAVMMQQTEFQVFKAARGHPDGKVPVDEENDERGKALVKLLKRPNKLDSFGKWMFRCSQQKSLTGTALNMVCPNMIKSDHPDPVYEDCGTPFEMYNIPTATMIPLPVMSPEYPEGAYRVQPIYPYGPFSQFPVPNSAVGATIGGQWVMRFQYPHPLLRYDGYSPLTGLREQIDGLQAIDRSRWYKMKRTFRPNAVLSMEGVEGAEGLPMPEIERIRAEIEAAFMGPENVGNLLTLYPGAKLEEFGAVPAEMDYPNSWDQLTNFILGGFGITKPAAGMVEDAQYSTLFATLKQLHVLDLQPECDDIASEITHFLGPFFGPDYIIEIRCRRIDDHEIRLNQMNALITGKAITKNELRKKCEELGLPVTKEEWGEDIAGDPSPMEMQQQQEAMAQEQAAMAAEQGGAPAEQDPGALLGGAQLEGEAQVEQERPKPGKLGEGSLGPRKSLDVPARVVNRIKHLSGLKRDKVVVPKVKAYSTYDLITKSLTNGNGNGRH